MFLLGTLMSVNAQVLSYVASNGLMGWYPFNGNANDLSGNGNNGTVNGASLSNDRYSNSNSAYGFINNGDRITLNSVTQVNVIEYTVCGWFKNPNRLGASFFSGAQFPNNIYGLQLGMDGNSEMAFAAENGTNSVGTYSNISSYLDNNWHFFCVVFKATNGAIIDTSNLTIIIDNKILPKTRKIWGNQSLVKAPINNGGLSTVIGNNTYNYGKFEGLLDDFGFWNRALSSSEIKDLYNGCKLSISTEPLSKSSSINGQVKFNTLANDTTSSYQWQSNASNMGWANVPTSSFYSGVTSKKLTVNNIQVNNHKQLFRVIATKNTCKDTSVVAMLTVNDTCITSTTDTLYIKVNTSSLSNPVYNTVKVYHNPSSTQVIIDNGNYNTMGSYTAKIVNSIGQQVFQSVINQQQFVIDAKTMGGAGVYTLYITDANNKVVGVKKIVLQ